MTMEKSGFDNKGVENKNKEILNSIEFYDDSSEYIERMKKELEKLDLSGLEGMAIIDLENNLDGRNLVGYFGVDQAKKLLTENNQRKLLLMDVSDVEEVIKYRPEIIDLLKNKNVKFVRMPFDFKTIPEIMNKNN